MESTYAVGEEQKKQFAGAYLLKKMVETSMEVPVLLEGSNQFLEPVLSYLMEKEYVDIEENERYVPTENGREVLQRFLRRYYDFLRHFDIYCAVDLGEGAFAFERYFDFDHDQQEADWQRFLNDDRWEDLRVAVAAFKGLNPVEIVFMSYLNEGRYGETEDGWQFDLLLGSIWNEILEICNTALGIDDLGWEGEDGNVVTGEAVLKDVITQGAELQKELRQKEEELYGGPEERRDDRDYDEAEESVIIEEDEYEVYESYYDPYYVSPWWGVVVFF